jgi:hypothetical protein
MLSWILNSRRCALTGRAVTLRVLNVRDAATTRSASVHYP